MFYGLTNCYYAPLKSDLTYDTPHRLRGAVGIDIPTAFSVIADKNIAYGTKYETTKAKLELASIPDDMLVNVYRYQNSDGNYTIPSYFRPIPFALLGEYNTEHGKIRFVLYHVFPSEPTLSTETMNKKGNVEGVSIDLIMSKVRKQNNKVVFSVKGNAFNYCSEDSANFDSWFGGVNL